MKSTKAIIRLGSILCWIHATTAEANILSNGGFELGAPEDFGTLDAWSIAGNAFGYRSTPPSYTATEGVRLAVFNGGGNVFDGAVSQSFPTLPGRTYRLIFDHGITGLSGKKQRLLVAVDGNTRRLTQTIDITASGSATRWIQRDWNFTADSSLTTLTLADGSGGLSTTVTGAADMLIDNVQVIAPEASRLSVESLPENGVPLVVNTPDLDGFESGVTPWILKYANGDVVSLTAPLFHQGLRLAGWQKDGQAINGDQEVVLTITADTQVTAVYQPNQDPVTEDDSYATDIESLLVVKAPGVLTNDADADGDILKASLSSNPGNGSVTLVSDGSFTYMPEAGFTGSDSFRYMVTDGGSQSVEGTVNIIVRNTREHILVNGSFETGTITSDGIAQIDDWQASGRVFGYLSDGNYTARDGSRLAVFNGGGSDFSGSLAQSFTTTPGTAYRVNFDAGILASSNRKQRMDIRLRGDQLSSERTIELAATPGPAKWTEFSKTFIADASTTILSFSDSSGSLPSTQTASSDLLLDNVRVLPLGAALKLQVASLCEEIVTIDVGPPDFTGASAGAGSFERTYLQDTTVTLSAPPAIGESTFRHWLLNDSIYGSDPTVSFVMDDDQSWVAVYMLPSPPEAFADSYSTTEDETLEVAAPGLLANDLIPEPGVASAILESQASNGVVMLAHDGSFTYRPEPDFHGTDSFTYRVSNDAGSSDPVEVTVVVLPSNDAPQAEPSEWITMEDQDVQIRLDARDVDGDALVYDVDPPAHGMLSGTAPDLLYTPDPDFHGTDTFSWQVYDGELWSTAAIETIRVNPVNEAPESLDASYSTSSNESLEIILTGTDRDGDPLIFTIVEQPLSGQLIGEPPNLTYQAAEGWHGEDRFTFTVSDGVATSAPASITIQVKQSAIPVFIDWLKEAGVDGGAYGDSDGDQMSNLLEYVLGTNPALAEYERPMPTVSILGDGLSQTSAAENRVLFQFRRTDRSERDPTVTVGAEWSTSPTGGWQPADDAHGAIIQVMDDAAGPGIDLVQVSMPRPAEGRFFARLRVSYVSE